MPTLMAEVEHLVKIGVMKKVNRSEWAVHFLHDTNFDEVLYLGH